MKRIFLVMLLVFMVGAFYSEVPFVGSAEFEFVANNNGVLEYDGIFAISKGQVSLSIEEYITTDNGVVTADYPEFVFDYSIGDFVFEATIANYLGVDFSYKKNFADVFTINPSAYYNHVVVPDVANDGTYGFVFVLSKGTKLFAPINFSVEIDGDYSDDWLYTLCLDLSYKVGNEKYFISYVSSDVDLTNYEKEIDAGVKFSFIEGIVFDANWVFEENSYSFSTTISY